MTLFQEADEALKTGGAEGLSAYQEKTAQAQALVQQAQQALGGTAPTTTAAERRNRDPPDCGPIAAPPLRFRPCCWR